MIILQNATYIHPNKDILFQDINLTIADQEKIALIGNNGSGKSTLLKVIAGQLQLNNGTVSCDSIPYYIPQLLDEYNDLTIAAALGISDKLIAFKEILLGNMTEHNLELLNDDWSIEDRCQNALSEWKLTDISLDHKIGELSGGQKTKVFLAGITIQEPQIILMDEPSNHLDHESRELLYQFIKDCRKTLLVVSHDRTLLNLIPEIAEMTKQGIVKYGGNYEFFAEQKELAMNALDHDVKSKEKELRKAREKEKEALERQNKLNARGKKKTRKSWNT
jgi:ATPase subunit of ABC transporter with duplicated ATPase domains